MSLIIEQVSLDDAELLFALRNEKEALENSFDQKPTTWTNHISWFKTKINDPTVRIYKIKESKNTSIIGVVRFEPKDDVFTVVSISLEKSARKRKISANVLNLALSEYKAEFTSALIAEIRKDNIASELCFQRCGFSLYDERQDRRVFIDKSAIINEIEKVRSRNNVNWMDLMRLAFRVAPHQAEEIFSRINNDDDAIATLLKKLTMQYTDQ